MSFCLVETVKQSDLNDLFAFELENRAFFESKVNARDAMFYCREGVGAAIERAQAEAESGTAQEYLVRSELGALVGRVNLTRIRRAHFHSAELGYRIAREACGQGFATKAVTEVLKRAFLDLKLRRVEAAVAVENIESVKVLERNGFSQFGLSKSSFELGGVWHDRLHFERHSGV